MAYLKSHLPIWFFFLKPFNWLFSLLEALGLSLFLLFLIILQFHSDFMVTCLGESLFSFIVFDSQWVHQPGWVQETKITQKFG